MVELTRVILHLRARFIEMKARRRKNSRTDRGLPLGTGLVCLEETGELRPAASGEWAAEHLSNTEPVEDKQTPEHQELNSPELIKTNLKDPLNLALICAWKDPGTNKDFKFLEGN